MMQNNSTDTKITPKKGYTHYASYISYRGEVNQKNKCQPISILIKLPPTILHIIKNIFLTYLS